MRDAMNYKRTTITGAMYPVNFLALNVFYFIYLIVALEPRNLLRMREP